MIRRFALLLSLSSLPLNAEPVQEIRVMSWNLHHGEGEDGKIDLERIATRIREQKPDLVVLQEVDNKCRRSKSVDQAAELAKLTGLTGVFGKAMDHDGGEYGQAILSKHSLGETKVYRLPGEGEPRIAFEAVVNFKGQPLRLVSVHLDHQEDGRRLKQAEILVKELSVSKEPLILAGDFNDVPGSAAMKVFGDALRPVEKSEPRLTCPAGEPKMEIDHVFLRGLEVASPVTVLPEAVASDHRPLVMTARFGEEK